MITTDVIVAGGGPVGLAAAISFAKDGRRVSLIERVPEPILARPAFDGREIALTHHASSWLRSVGAWDHIPSSAVSPLKTARVETGSDHHNGRPLLFKAPDEGPAALGHLVANHLIRSALYAVVCETPGISLHCGNGIEAVRTTRAGASVRLDKGMVHEGRVMVVADGRFSRVREMLGIGAVVHDFRSRILVCRLRHPKPHEATALQWFDEGQTIALLPVAPDGREGDLSSLVLTLPGDEIDRLQRVDEETFNEEITRRTQGRFGPVAVETARCTYPLKAVYAHRFISQRCALVGDAAVGMHPITAHGFNLGLRGQEMLARVINEGSGDPGDPSALRRYQRTHRAATFPLFAATNGIAEIYSTDRGPIPKIRRAGLGVADSLKPFKAFVEGLLMGQSTRA